MIDIENKKRPQAVTRDLLNIRNFRTPKNLFMSLSQLQTGVSGA